MVRGILFGLLFQSLAIAFGTLLLAVGFAVASTWHNDKQARHPEQFTQGYDWRQPPTQY